MFYGCICIWYLNHCLFNLHQILNCVWESFVQNIRALRSSGLLRTGTGWVFICFNRFDLRLANIVPKLSCSSVVIQNMLRDSVHSSHVSGCGGWQSEQAISSFSQKLFLCLLLTFSICVNYSPFFHLSCQVNICSVSPVCKAQGNADLLILLQEDQGDRLPPSLS